MLKETALTLRERIQEQIGENAKVSAADAAGYARATADIVDYARGNSGAAWPRDVLQFADAIERGDFRKGAL